MFSRILIKLFGIFIVTFPLARSRHYDLETECFKLYGEEFSAILRKFRRTPEYLSLLEDRRKILDIRFQEVAVQVMQSQETRLVQKVAEMVGHVTQATTTAHNVKRELLYNYKPMQRSGYNEGDRDTTTTEDPVRKLDGYYMLHRALQTHDRNHFRDLGFELAGQTVHLIIKGMGPVGQSTDDNGIDPSESNTKALVHDHEVHSTVYVTMIPQAAVTSVDDTHNVKHKQTDSFIR